MMKNETIHGQFLFSLSLRRETEGELDERGQDYIQRIVRRLGKVQRAIEIAVFSLVNRFELLAYYQLAVYAEKESLFLCTSHSQLDSMRTEH